MNALWVVNMQPSDLDLDSQACCYNFSGTLYGAEAPIRDIKPGSTKTINVIRKILCSKLFDCMEKCKKKAKQVGKKEKMLQK